MPSFSVLVVVVPSRSSFVVVHHHRRPVLVASSCRCCHPPCPCHPPPPLSAVGASMSSSLRHHHIVLVRLLHQSRLHQPLSKSVIAAASAPLFHRTAYSHFGWFWLSPRSVSLAFAFHHGLGLATSGCISPSICSITTLARSSRLGNGCISPMVAPPMVTTLARSSRLGTGCIAMGNGCISPGTY